MTMWIESLRAPNLGMICGTLIGVERKAHPGIDHDLVKEKGTRKIGTGIDAAEKIGMRIERETRGMGEIVSKIGIRKEDRNMYMIVIVNGKNVIVIRELRKTETNVLVVAGAIQTDIMMTGRGVETGNLGKGVGIGNTERGVGTGNSMKKKADILEKSSDGHSGK